MKLIIAGSRKLEVHPEFILRAVDTFIPREKIDCIISGGAKGIDTCAERFAAYMGYDFKCFPADWDRHGNAAGPQRNIKMSKHGDALLLIWDGASSGSQHMKNQMLNLKKPVYEVCLRSYDFPEAVEPKIKKRLDGGKVIYE